MSINSFKKFCSYQNVSRETYQKFQIYYDTLVKWQKSINLISRSNSDDIYLRHFLDSAQLYKFTKKINGNILDFGSGAGFPGLVLALMGNKNVILVESDQKKCAFFSVNVVARKSEKNTAETNPYINKFLKISKWKPDKISVFAGKVDYPSYNFFEKYIIKFIMFITKGPTDTSQSYEFTDWSKVDDFSKELKNNYLK